MGVTRLLSEIGLSQASILSFLVFFPWAVFATNFAGRSHLITRRRLYIGILVCVFAFGPIFADIYVAEFSFDEFELLSVLSSALTLSVLAVVFIIAGAVVVSAYRHQSLSIVHGLVAVLPLVAIMLIVQLTRDSLPIFNDIVFVTMSITIAGALTLLPTRYNLLQRRAGTGTIGERTAIREMNEVIITVERGGMLARANDAAEIEFGSSLSDQLFADVIGHEATELIDQDTVECWTERGHKQFDPRVTELANAYGEVIGYTIVLIDITDREIRRQRIEVLNRILRHNIRNRLDVIKADAELVADDDRATSILETTDTLKQLSGDARRIETLMQRSQHDQPSTEITDIVESVTERMTAEYQEASITLDFSIHSVQIDAELCRFALENIVENAVVHNDRDCPRVEIRGEEIETGVRIIVADDGPGIPERERSVIENQTETPQSHASSLGLWGTNWAVQQLGGDLSFRESSLGGTTVVLEIPVY
jgi:signal transduction histidine kinase